MLNNINLVGRLTKDCELRYTQNKKAKIEFVIAVTTGYGSYQRTDFIPVEAFGKEKLQPYLQKGTLVSVTGGLHIDRYETKNKEKKSFTKVVARDIALLGSKSKDEASFTPPGNFEEIDMEVPF